MTVPLKLIMIELLKFHAYSYGLPSVIISSGFGGLWNDITWNLFGARSRRYPFWQRNDDPFYFEALPLFMLSLIYNPNKALDVIE